MQSYGSFQSVSNLLRLVQLDYGLSDDLTVKYLHPLDSLSVPVPVPLPLSVALPLKPVLPLPTVSPEKVKKDRKTLVHKPGVSCSGTNRFGKLCCNSRAKDSAFCRWHLDQKDSPVAPRLPVDDTPAESFSVHTPAVVSPPVVSPPADRSQSQEKFMDLARTKCGCEHLVKRVVFADYEGFAIALDDNFQQAPLFRQLALTMGLFLAEDECHLIPTGYMPDDESVSQNLLDDTDEPEVTSPCMDEPTAHTPVYHTDTEDDDEESPPMTEALFETYATSSGLDDEFDTNDDIPDDYHPYGVYINPFSSTPENLDLLRTTLEGVGFRTDTITLNENEDEPDQYFVVFKDC